LKPRVRAIEADLKRDEANGSNQFRTSAEFRIRRDQCEMIKKKLNDLLQMFNHTQVEYKQRVSSELFVWYTVNKSGEDPLQIWQDRIFGEKNRIFGKNILLTIHCAT
jgi:hypothetical protein